MQNQFVQIKVIILLYYKNYKHLTEPFTVFTIVMFNTIVYRVLKSRNVLNMHIWRARVLFYAMFLRIFFKTTIIHKYNLVTLSWNTPMKNIFEFLLFLNTAASV